MTRNPPVRRATRSIANRCELLLFRTSARRAMKGGNFLADYWIVRSFVDIDLSPMSIVLWHVGVGEDRFNRALGDTRIAVDAGVSINVKTIRQLMKCFDGAHCSAV